MTAATSTARARYRGHMTAYAWSRLARAASRRLVTCVRGCRGSVEVWCGWDVDGFVASLTGRATTRLSAYEHDVRQFVAWAERGGCPQPDAARPPHAAPLPRVPRHPRLRPPHRSPARPRRCGRTSGTSTATGSSPTDPGRSPARAEGRGAPAPGAPPAPRPSPCSTPPAAGRARTDDDAAGAATAWRDLAVLEVLYGAGLRVSECCGLTLADVDLDRGLRHRARQGLQGPARARSASRRRRARARTSRDGRPELVDRARLRPTPCSSTAGAGALTHARRPPDRRRHPLPDGRHLAPARAPARVRYAPARRRRRPAGRAGAARPRRSRDHADLHPRDPRPPAGRLRSDPSPCLTSTTDDAVAALWRDYKARRHAPTRASG